mmetsp:Transcript_19014/g.36055  ORF Transcript_19014/g.36055 Transcript_19014/m.36055 type:complete len:179 (-) Transcript_19014:355-891(-)
MGLSVAAPPSVPALYGTATTMAHYGMTPQGSTAYGIAHSGVASESASSRNTTYGIGIAPSGSMQAAEATTLIDDEVLDAHQTSAAPDHGTSSGDTKPAANHGNAPFRNAFSVSASAATTTINDGLLDSSKPAARHRDFFVNDGLSKYVRRSYSLTFLRHPPNKDTAIFYNNIWPGSSP